MTVRVCFPRTESQPQDSIDSIYGQFIDLQRVTQTGMYSAHHHLIVLLREGIRPAALPNQPLKLCGLGLTKYFREGCVFMGSAVTSIITHQGDAAEQSGCVRRGTFSCEDAIKA